MDEERSTDERSGRAKSGDYVVALTTLGSEEAAIRLARDLLDRRLVACVNVLPSVRSLYRWKGKVEDDREQLLIMKTHTDRVARLEASVKELHPYEVPELLVLQVESGAASYLAWIDACLES